MHSSGKFHNVNTRLYQLQLKREAATQNPHCCPCTPYYIPLPPPF